MVILICFKRCSILKKFDKKLKEENIEFDKESNGDWYNYRFNDKNILLFILWIHIIKYFIVESVTFYKMSI